MNLSQSMLKAWSISVLIQERLKAEGYRIVGAGGSGSHDTDDASVSVTDIEGTCFSIIIRRTSQ
jgi:hypothetical protein